MLEKGTEAGRGEGEKQLTAAWRQHHVHHVVPVALSPFFACFAHRKLELDVIFHAQTTCKAGGTRALKYYAYAACAAVLLLL